MKNAGFEKQKKRTAQRKVRKSFLAVVLVFIISVLLILCMTVLFPVKKIEVSYSGERYTKKEIISSSGITVGENIVMLSGGDTADKVTKSLPYIGELEVKKEFPDTVKLVAKETSRRYCLPYGKRYVILDDNFKVLEKTKEYVKAATCVNGISISRAELGETVVFKSDEQRMQLKKICEGLKKHSISVQYVDFKTPSDIKIYADKKFTVLLGTASDIDDKLNFLYKMIPQIEKKDKKDKGTINLGYFGSKKEGYFTSGEFKLTYFDEEK